MQQAIERMVLTEQEIGQCVTALAEKITQDYKERSLLCVGVLTGGVFFTADLVRRIGLPLELDFVSAESYRNGTTSGELVLKKEPSIDPKGKDVLLLEDVVDTGKTLSHLVDYYQSLGSHSVTVCTLLDKPGCRQVPVEVRYIGATVGNDFLVGYGLDYAQQYRNLPYVGVLKDSVIAKTQGKE